jgi:hypothetical protein
MPKTFISSLLSAILVILSCGVGQASMTIATFADPSTDSVNPLFTVNLVSDTITGGWADSKTGLYLMIPYSGNSYSDAFFTMTNVNYTGSASGGVTGGGTIKFFADGQSTSTTPLIQIDFVSGSVSPYGFAGMDEFFANGVVITGSETGTALSGESFSFSFANQKALSSNWNNGYTATASFTSSAVPEPATMAMFGLGGLLFARKKQLRSWYAAGDAHSGCRPGTHSNTTN